MAARDKPPVDNPLLKKAMSLEVKSGPKEKEYSINELDLFIRFYHGEITASQVAHALGGKMKSHHVHSYASRALKQWIAKGRVTIVWKGQG